MLATLLTLFCNSIARASDVTELAACTVEIFKEINRSHKWSGEPPSGCPATVVVEKRQEGIFITTWKVEKVSGGWTNTAFSSAQGLWEIASKKDLANANQDIMARARRLGKCLDSIRPRTIPLNAGKRR